VRRPLNYKYKIQSITGNNNTTQEYGDRYIQNSIIYISIANTYLVCGFYLQVNDLYLFETGICLMLVVDYASSSVQTLQTNGVFNIFQHFIL